MCALTMRDRIQQTPPAVTIAALDLHLSRAGRASKSDHIAKNEKSPTNSALHSDLSHSGGAT